MPIWAKDVLRSGRHIAVLFCIGVALYIPVLVSAGTLGAHSNAGLLYRPAWVSYKPVARAVKPHHSEEYFCVKSEGACKTSLRRCTRKEIQCSLSSAGLSDVPSANLEAEKEAEDSDSLDEAATLIAK